MGHIGPLVNMETFLFDVSSSAATSVAVSGQDDRPVLTTSVAAIPE